MKRIASFFLSSCIFILLLSINIFAETNRDIYNESVEQNKEYDSTNLTEEEMEKYSLTREYNDIVCDFGGDVEASLAFGFDIRLLNDDSGLLKVYSYDPRQDMIDGVPVSEIANKVENAEYIKALNNEVIVRFVRGYAEFYYTDTDKYPGEWYEADIYDCVFNAKSIFESVEATKSLGEVEILQTYAFGFETETTDIYGDYPSVVYFVTSKGDYIFYSRDISRYYKTSSYLIDVETFKDATAKMFEMEESFYDGAVESLNVLEAYADLSDCIVGENVQPPNGSYYIERYLFFKNDPDFNPYNSQYCFAKGIGLDKLSQLRDTMMRIDPAYEGAFFYGGWLPVGTLTWHDFLEMLADAGCTTYAECRAYIDAAIEAKENPLPDTDVPTDDPDSDESTIPDTDVPTDDPDSDESTIPDTDVPTVEDKSEPNNQPSTDGKSYKFLIWLIPSAVVAISGAVAVAVILKKKKRT